MLKTVYRASNTVHETYVIAVVFRTLPHRRSAAIISKFNPFDEPTTYFQICTSKYSGASVIITMVAERLCRIDPTM